MHFRCHPLNGGVLSTFIDFPDRPILLVILEALIYLCSGVRRRKEDTLLVLRPLILTWGNRIPINGICLIDRHITQIDAIVNWQYILFNAITTHSAVGGYHSKVILNESPIKLQSLKWLTVMKSVVWVPSVHNYAHQKSDGHHHYCTQS